MYMFIYQMQQLKYYYKGLLQRSVNKTMNIKTVYTYIINYKFDNLFLFITNYLFRPRYLLINRTKPFIPKNTNNNKNIITTSTVSSLQNGPVYICV